MENLLCTRITTMSHLQLGRPFACLFTVSFSACETNSCETKMRSPFENKKINNQPQDR